MDATRSRRILVVDDDQDVRESLASLLGGMGFDARTAVNGKEALEVLRDMVPLPCLILLDLLMPEMNGEEFRQQQTGDPELADIPVVLVSANSDLSEKASSLNVAGALRKPISFSALSAITERHCVGTGN